MPGSQRHKPTVGITTTCRPTRRRGATPWPTSTRTHRPCYGGGFATCSYTQQTDLIQAVQDLGSDDWHGRSAAHAWSLWTRYACTAFYSHPAAWDEIGFAGPAYPRGYKNLGIDSLEGHEVRDSKPRRRPATTEPLMAGVRTRNESAWLLPNDGTRTNHRLRQDMRRFADHDEVDMVIVGCGAGGSTMLQRLARAGWKVVALDAGPFWDPDADWVSDEAGSHQLYWTEPRVIAGRRSGPAGVEQLRPRSRRVDGALRRLHAAVPPERLRHAQPRRRGCGLADQLRGPAAVLRGHRRRTAGRRREVALGRPAQLSAPPAPGMRQRARSSCAARTAWASPRRSGRSPSPTGASGNRPHCIYRGFCLQGCKVNAKASPLITHIPDALAHGAEVRADSMVTRIEIDERTGRATGRALHARRGRAVPASRDVIVAGYSIETPRLLLNSTSQAVPRRAVQRLRPGRPLPDGPGRATDRRPVRRRGADVQGAAPGGHHRAVLRDRPEQPYKRGFSIQTVSPLPITWAEHFAAQGTGAPRCAST